MFMCSKEVQYKFVRLNKSKIVENYFSAFYFVMIK